MLRKFLEFYRRILYFIFQRRRDGILEPGRLCEVEDVEFEVNHGDIVHPCVRYVDNGFMGHKWWMIYTPYYKANARLENPILCYGNSSTMQPPLKWSYFKKIVNGYPIGYNSDPNILIQDNKMHIFWRENQTLACCNNRLSRLTRKITLSDNVLSDDSGPLLVAKKEYVDYEVSPAFQYKDGRYIAFATGIKFFNPAIRRLPNTTRKLINKILLLVDLAGLKSQKKSYGITQWSSPDLNNTFSFERIIKVRNKNYLYQPWHLDVFDWDGNTYAVIQSNQCNADILLAKLINNEFVLYRKPLITNKSIGKVGIYKPTAIVVDGMFILYYTAQEKHTRGKNNLYMTSLNFRELLKKFE